MNRRTQTPQRIPLQTLSPGDYFTLPGLKDGKVIHIGAGSVEVEYRDTPATSFTIRRGPRRGEVVNLPPSPRRTTVALTTMVLPGRMIAHS